jgi:hypothetical protein
MLRDIKLCEGLEHIDPWAFYNCTSLEGIIVPSNLKGIGEGTCFGCTRNSLVELREGLEEIHERAFSLCKSIQQISIPSMVKYIATDAFDFCDGSVEIIFSSGVKFLLEVSLPEWLVADGICKLPEKYHVSSAQYSNPL